MSKSTKFTFAKADAVIRRMLEVPNLITACREEGVPVTTFRRWLAADREGIRKSYARMLAIKADVLEDACDDIADDSSKDYVWGWGRSGPRVDHKHLRRCAARIKSLQRRADRYRAESYRLLGIPQHIIIQITT